MFFFLNYNKKKNACKYYNYNIIKPSTFVIPSKKKKKPIRNLLFTPIRHTFGLAMTKKKKQNFAVFRYANTSVSAFVR